MRAIRRSSSVFSISIIPNIELFIDAWDEYDKIIELMKKHFEIYADFQVYVGYEKYEKLPSICR